MTLETVCTECGRPVGVVRAPSLGGEPPRYKVAVHADRDRAAANRQRRPRCGGTGIEPDPAMTYEVTTGAEHRRRHRGRADIPVAG